MSVIDQHAPERTVPPPSSALGRHRRLWCALFEVPKRYKEPVLGQRHRRRAPSCAWFFEWNMHDTVGIDLVAMSVNDVGSGPSPRFPITACGKLDRGHAAAVVGGDATKVSLKVADDRRRSQ
jgi:phosphoribosylaminoimidazole (AIR) synthetase